MNDSSTSMRNQRIDAARALRRKKPRRPDRSLPVLIGIVTMALGVLALQGFLERRSRALPASFHQIDLQLQGMH